ncbi:hypothetical protein OHS81_17060 [Streptomyces sp. NBC_00400]|uniref:hypothetical protein n=1 Tax=Streptomyces sp. NBC_00400 TaxID=2975737 RepID=UPI002E228A27
MATDPSEYEAAVPILAAHLAKIERAVGRTRALCAGQPYDTVRQVLAEGLIREGAQRVVPQVVDDLACQIAEDSGEAPF